MSNASSRVGETWRLLRGQGPAALGRRVVRAAYQRSGAAALEFPLLPDDLADSTRLDLPRPTSAPERGTPLTVAWIMTPPGAGSGGHTTIFRMIEALEAAGHRCVLHLYDRFGGDLERHTAVIRSGWPAVRAEVREVGDGLAGADAAIATSWETAHVLARRSAGMRVARLYFAQDFEPFFYPRGTEYALAEDTYRFGFRTITIGHMVADLLASTADVDCAVAQFGCDTAVYGLRNTGPRRGIAFYAKPGNPRRGFLLASAALDEVHRRHPACEIHLYGDRDATVPFPAEVHGNVSPAGLSDIYNQCVTGLAMSFTNISLIAEELLACGTIPVVNDSPYARADLQNPYVEWATATPGSIADALSRVIERDGRGERSAEIAASVRQGRWEPAQRVVLDTVEDEVYGAPG